MKIFGQRLLLAEDQEAEEQLQNGIFVPKDNKRAYLFCTVAEIGSGKLSSGQTPQPTDVSVGDTVFLQINPALDRGSAHTIDGKRYFVSHWGDVLAVVTSRPPTPESFRPVGRWVVAEVKIEQELGGIILPNQTVHKSVGKVTFTVFKSGVQAQEQLGLEAGQEVLIDKARANVFMLGTRRFVYVDSDYVTGRV